ncbi:MAG: FecR family protein [Chloroflexota bacterium]|nr:FecR family protein [Chloroflexota bacterium]
MNKKWLWIIGGVLLAVACLVVIVGVAIGVMLVSPGGEEGTPARIVKVVADVDAHPRSEDDWIAAAVDMLVYGGGQVRTGADSSAQLELREGAVRLSAYTLFTVEESMTEGGVWLTRLLLDRGRLWVNLDTDQPHEFTVDTGIALAAVRDTRFSVNVVGDTALVSVADGEVDLTAQGQTVTVRVGEQATAEKGRPPSPPVPMDEAERALWATEGGEPDMAPPTPTPTFTPTATSTPTPIPTATPLPPTATMIPPTATSIPPTATPVPPTVVSGSPTIISIDFPGQVAADGSSVRGTVRFRDPDGDINWVTFDVVRATDFTSFEYNPLDSVIEGDVTDGVFAFYIWCNIDQTVTLRTTLSDEAGNSSAPVDFSFTCR